MMAIASLGLLLSTICDNPLTATGLTIAILFVCQALGLIPYFKWLEPYLLTYISVYHEAFASTIDWAQIAISTKYLAAYIFRVAIIYKYVVKYLLHYG